MHVAEIEMQHKIQAEPELTSYDDFESIQTLVAPSPTILFCYPPLCLHIGQGYHPPPS